MLEMAENPLSPDARDVVVQESCDSATGRHKGVHGGRFEAGNDPNQVRKQDEQKQRAEKSDVALAAVTYHVLCLSLDKLIDQFERLLKFTRTINGKPSSQESKEDHDICATRSCMVTKLSHGRC